MTKTEILYYNNGMDIPKQELDNILVKISSIRAYANIFLVNELKKKGIDGIRPSHGAIIGVLIVSEKPVLLTDLVRETGRVKSTITVTVRTLEKHGYIKRFKTSGNKKSVFVKLTPKGEKIQGELKSIAKDLIDKVYGDMPISERKQLITFLNKLQRNISS